MSEVTGSRRARKSATTPKKPYPSFPLGPHPSGKWQKKIRGKVYYFGNWARRVNGKLVRVEGDGWKDALDLYKAQADDLHAGRAPRSKTGDDYTLKDLCNEFLTAKQRKLDAAEIVPQTLTDYKQITDMLIKQFGSDRLVDDLAAADFEALRAKFAESWGPARLGNAITRVRTIFKYGYASGRMTVDPAQRYGSEFKKPSMSVMRRHRAAAGPKMFEPHEIQALLKCASVPMAAMILLGVNCGFGNHDCATLPESALDLESGWVDFPRPKTGIPRRCPLWPETVTALRKAIAKRTAPKPAAKGFVFTTSRGNRWLSNGVAITVAVGFGELMKNAGVHRRGRGFYALRHTFRTVADESRDLVAANLVMGHADHSMGAAYTERIDDERLVSVTDHVRAWLFPAAADKPAGQTGKAAQQPAKPPQQRRQPISRRMPAVVVEYDSRGERVKRLFESAHQAKSFYLRAEKAGRHPKLMAPGAVALRVVG